MIENKNNLNIKDLILEHPAQKSDFNFDPKKDLSSKQLLKIGNAMEEYAKNFDCLYFSSDYTLAHRAMYFHLLMPDKLRSVINDMRWRSMKNTLVDTMQGENVADTLAIMKLTAPDRMAHGVTVSQTSWNEMIRKFDQNVREPSEIEGMYSAMRMARSFKLWANDDRVQISEATRNKMYESVVRFMPTMSKQDANTMLADFRLVDEKRFQKYKKEQPLEFKFSWNYLKNKLLNDEVNIIAIGALSILGADSIQIENGKIVLVNNESMQLPVSDLIPERRKF